MQGNAQSTGGPITDPYSLFELFWPDHVHGGIIKATITNYNKEWAASMILQLTWPHHLLPYLVSENS